METKYTGEIELEDLILVGSYGGMDAGFYAGQGKTGTLQYYTLYSLSNWFDKIQTKNSDEKSKPWKSYINTPQGWRVAKLHPDNLADEHIENYKKSLEALRLLKLRK